MEIKVAVSRSSDHVSGERQVALETLDLDGQREREVLVRITSCGVCSDDVACLHTANGYPAPGVLGHEGAGVVEAIGDDVTLVAPGDHVVVGLPFCGECRNCRRGQQRYCESIHTLLHSGLRPDGSTPPRRWDGERVAGRFLHQPAWATYTVALQQQLTKVPEHVDLDLMGPLGCSVSTGAGIVLNELRPDPGSSIVIFGSGAVGLSALLAANLTGASNIIVVDTSPRRLALALELGATHTIARETDAVEEIRDLTSGGADFAIECTSGGTRVAEGMRALAKLGTCAMVGGAGASASVSVDHADTMLSGKRLIGCAGGGGQAPEFIRSLMELQVRGRFPLQKLVRHYDFADIDQAIKDREAGTVVKPILRMH